MFKAAVFISLKSLSVSGFINNHSGITKLSFVIFFSSEVIDCAASQFTKNPARIPTSSPNSGELDKLTGLLFCPTPFPFAHLSSINFLKPLYSLLNLLSQKSGTFSFNTFFIALLSKGISKSDFEVIAIPIHIATMAINRRNNKKLKLHLKRCQRFSELV